METQKVDQFCHSRGELYDEIDRPCVKCGHKRRSTPDNEGDERLQGRIQRFWIGGEDVGQHGCPRKKIFGFRWSKKAKITLETR